jgi:hypothetical protein
VKIYELTKQDVENINKLNTIEDIINTESEKLRKELYKNRDKDELNLSSFRYGRLIYLYKSWSGWQEIIWLGFVPIIFAILLKDKSIQGEFCLVIGLIFSIGIIISGLRGRAIRNKIKTNFEKLGLDLDNLK